MSSDVYNVDLDSNFLALNTGGEESLRAALLAAGAKLVRFEPPRFTVAVTAVSPEEAEARALAAANSWVIGPGAGWRVVGV